MEKILYQNPSPTLPGIEERTNIRQLTKQIDTICTLYRSTTAKLQITAFTDNHDWPGVLDLSKPLVINLSELPDELRTAFHDYATRLIGERMKLEAQTPNENL